MTSTNGICTEFVTALEVTVSRLKDKLKEYEDKEEQTATVFYFLKLLTCVSLFEICFVHS